MKSTLLTPVRTEEKRSLLPTLHPTLSHMQQTMNEMFNDLFSGFGWSGVTSAPFQSMWSPALDLYQKDNTLVAECAVPGLRKEDIRISLTNNVLTIEGELRRHDQRSDGLYHSEIESGTFFRRISLPMDVKADQCKATVENGILHVVMPTTQPMQNRVTIPVS